MTHALSEAETRAAEACTRAAERYCAVVDSHAKYRAAGFVRSVHTALTALYGAALELTTVEPSAGDSAPGPVTTEYESALSHGLAATMAPYHIHWFVFDPVEHQPAEPVPGHLPADLSEIYRDVRNSRAGWTNRDLSTRRDSLWQMHFDFTSHWGRHAVTAMAAMHSLLHDQHIEALDDA